MNGNGERRKHDARDCAWGSDITTIKTTLGILVDQIKIDNEHRSEVDEKQFDLLYEHTGKISGLQADVKNLDKRINSKVPAPAAATANCPEPTLWQAICKIKKFWFLFIFLGGGTFLIFFASLLEQIAEWLKSLALTGGVP